MNFVLHFVVVLFFKHWVAMHSTDIFLDHFIHYGNCEVEAGYQNYSEGSTW